MIGRFYDHGQWVALHLQLHPETGDTLVVARLGKCPGDADGRDVTLARRPTASAALDRALHRLTAGWRHTADEPPAPPASARKAFAHPTPLDLDASVDPGGRPGTPERARAIVDHYALDAEGAGSASPAVAERPGPLSRTTDHPPRPTHQEDAHVPRRQPARRRPYAAAVHTVELDGFGYSFRPVAPSLFTRPIDVARLEALDDGGERRAVLHAARGR